MAAALTYQEIGDALKSRLPEGFSPKLLVICGSGLGGLAKTVDDPVAIPFWQIEGFPRATVAGHKGEVVFGRISGLEVMCLNGRFHSYEGHDMKTVTLPVRVAAHLGVDTLIVTNAAGGLNPDFNVGDIMVMSDHIFLPGMAGRNPLVGPNEPGPDGAWPRFVPMSNAYDQRLAEMAYACGQAEGLAPQFMHREGVYAMVSGPNYESCGECRFLRMAGADAVGMSTAPEVVVARHCGMRVLGFSLITNKCVLTPSGGPPANHEEVIEAANMRAVQMQALVRRIVGNIREPEGEQKKGGC